VECIQHEKKKQWLGGQQIFARNLATIYKMYWKLIEVFSQEISGMSNIIWKKKTAPKVVSVLVSSDIKSLARCHQISG